jgi:hypothetical protein
MSPSSTRRSASKPARRRLAVETLESRLTPAVSLTSAELTNYATLSGQPGSTLDRDHALDFQVDADGNRYALGFAGNTDYSVRTFHLTKFDPAGNQVWFTSFTRPDYDIGGAIALDPGGAVYVAMKRYQTNVVDQIEIVKVDAAGQPVPGQTYAETRAATLNENAGIVDITTDAAGFVYYTYPGHTVKLESQASALVRVDDYAIGGAALDVSPDGNRVYVTGRFSGIAVDFDPYNAYADNHDKLSTGVRSRDTTYNDFILELTRSSPTSALQFAWVGQVGSTSNNDCPDDIIFDDSGVYVLGYYPDNGAENNTSTDFNPDPAVRYSLPVDFGGQELTGNIFLLKLDLNHQFQWVNGLGGTAQNSSDSDGGPCGHLFLDEQGGVYVADTFHGAGADFDIEHSYPGNIDRPAGGGSDASDQNLFVAKYGTSSGAFRWVATGITTGAYSAGAGGVVVSGAEITVFARSRGTIVLNPGNVALAADARGDLILATLTQTADPVQLYVKNVVQPEGNTGTTGFTFLLMLSDPVGYDVTVTYATANGTATPGSDYTAQTGSVTFLAGETQKQVTVLVTGDGTAEVDETFALNLSAPILGVDGSLTAWASISNDDAVRGKK